MREERVTFLGRVKRTPTVESFRFAPSRKVDFLPGQFVQVMFDPQHPQEKELNKYLSLSAAPGREYLEVTKRISASAFSQRLLGLREGDEVVLRGPMGSCVFKEDEMGKVGFLIGGIGITPVISILGYVMEKRLPTDVCLVYSNRTDEDIAFKPELDSWLKENPRLKVSYLVSDCQPKDKTCSFGVIDTRVVQERVCNITERVFFLFGPPRMVASMQEVCVGLGCDPGNVKTESFIGY